MTDLFPKATFDIDLFSKATDKDVARFDAELTKGCKFNPFFGAGVFGRHDEEGDFYVADMLIENGFTAIGNDIKALTYECRIFDRVLCTIAEKAEIEAANPNFMIFLHEDDAEVIPLSYVCDETFISYLYKMDMETLNTLNTRLARVRIMAADLQAKIDYEPSLDPMIRMVLSVYLKHI